MKNAHRFYGGYKKYKHYITYNIITYTLRCLGIYFGKINFYFELLEKCEKTNLEITL